MHHSNDHLSVPLHPETGALGEMGYRLNKLLKALDTQHHASMSHHEQFINAIQASPNGVLLLAADDAIAWCNAEAARHLHVDRQRDRGQPITNLIRHPDFIAAMQALKQQREAVTTNAVAPMSMNLTNPSYAAQQAQVISLRLIPYEPDHTLIITQDISETIRIETMRREFMANVSHELKTPVAVIAGALENLRELPLQPEERADTMAHISKQVVRLTSLIDDVLTLAKLEAEPPPQRTRVAMSKMLIELRDNAFTLSSAEHSIRVEAEEGVDLLGAHNELYSAFGNLISNAVRYSPEGGRITIRWQREASTFLGEAGRLGGCFSVSDEGLGIPKALHHRLTERFYRVDISRSAETGGTGLGLAIVKHTMLRHGGIFAVDSEIGQGSTFSLHFPAANLVTDTPERS